MPPLLMTLMLSLPAVPLTFTVSAAPSPRCRASDRSMATCVTPVPVRSLTVMVRHRRQRVELIRSTLLRSMVMSPTSRVSRTRPPLAEMSIFSPMLEPLNCIVSVPSWPSTVSLPSPGFQTKVSLPAPSKAVSLPRPPLTVSLPSPPSSISAPSPPVMVSLPAPPSMVRRIRFAAAWLRGDGVAAIAAIDDQRVVAGLAASDVDLFGQAR